ncbi:MAG: peptidoglycan-binding domain-containing protein [Candidatus Omnitrophota bacterium]
MLKKACVFSLAFFTLVLLSGCATGRKQKDLEIQGLRNQVLVLESQVQSKDEEINNLKESLARAAAEKETSQVSAKQSGKRKAAGEIKSRPKARQIQSALKNAGYDPGHVDGRMGKQTRDAVKEFQRANNLPVTGKVNKGTWALLREYLNKKVK